MRAHAHEDAMLPQLRSILKYDQRLFLRRRRFPSVVLRVLGPADKAPKFNLSYVYSALIHCQNYVIGHDSCID